MYVCMYVCIYIYIYIHKHVFTRTRPSRTQSPGRPGPFFLTETLNTSLFTPSPPIKSFPTKSP